MAEGFQAGSSWVDVLPSLRGFQTKIAADIKKMFAGGIDVKVAPAIDSTRTDAEAGAFAARLHKKVGAAVKALPDVKLGIDANTNPVSRRILHIKRELEDLNRKRIGIDIDAAEADRRVKALSAELSKLAGKSTDVQVRADTAAAVAALDVVDRKASRLGRTFDLKVNRSLSQSVVGIAALSRAVGTLALPGAALAVTPYLLSLASSATQAGGAVALLPAFGFAAAAGMGALALGARGFSDAVAETDPKKYAEAVAKLAPAARETANQVKALAPAWKTMQLHVQQQLFEGIATRVRELSNTYLPVLNTQLGNLAARYNLAAQKSVNVLLAPRSVADTTLGLTNLNAATGNAALAAGPLTAAFRDLGVVGSTFLPAMGTAVTNLSTRFAGFIAHARETGQIRGWIQGGLDTLRRFGSVALNVGSIVRSAMDAARGSGQSFLVTIDQFTGRIAGALRTPEGSSGLTGFFTGVRTVVSGLIDRLIQLWPVVVAGGGAFLALWTSVQPFADVLYGLVTTVLPPLLTLIGTLAPILGPVIAAVLAMKLAVLAYTAAQWLLNAALNANPIGVVILALTALVAGLVWAWRSSETFRGIVIGAWQGIQTAVSAVWTGFLQPVFSAIVTAVQWLGSAVMWLWTTIFAPVFSFIGQAAMVLLAVVATIVIAPLILAFKALAPVVMWLWTNAFMPAFQGIAAVVEWAWNSIIRPVWDALVWFIRNVIAPAAQWLWSAIIVPVFQGIGAAISAAWTGVIRPTWDALVGFIRNVIAPAAQWLWNSIIRPVWDGIGSIIRGVWTGAIKPAWDALVGGLNWVGDNFNRVVGWIGDIWGRLRGFLARPINFLIGVVWNEGIVPAWNLVAGLLPGIDPIRPLARIPEMAQGGRIAGGTPGVDSVPIMAMQDEFVVRRKYAKPGRDFLEAFNAGQPEALQAAGLVRFAGGGPVEAIRNATQVARSMHGKPYVWGGSGRGGTDCSGFMAYLTRALRMESDPYRRIGTTATFPWPGFRPGLHSAFGVGNVPGSHMRGTLAGMNVESGGAHGHVAAGPPAAGVPYGSNYHLPEVGGQFIPGGGGGFIEWVKGQIRGWFRDIVDPRINQLPHPPPAFKGLPRKAAVKVRDTSLDWFLGQADNGAWLPPGWSTIYNGTRHHEAILTHQQLQDVAAGDGGIRNTWHIYQANDPTETAAKIERRQAMATRAGAPL
ncbi:MAG: hypothetical protein ACRDSL_04415 [Pseudonocardiaceae bacterium]